MPLQTIFPWLQLNRNLRRLAFALLLWALGDGLFYGFISLQAERLGANEVQVGNLLAFYALTQALVVLPSGIAADRFDLKKMMMMAWWVGVLGVVLMASASINIFTLGLGIFGISFMFSPPTSRYITMQREGLTTQRAFSLVYSAFTAGMTVSPWIGGWIAQRYGLRTNFWVAIVLLALSALTVGTLQTVPKDPNAEKPHWADFWSLLQQKQFVRYLLVMFISMVIFHVGMALSPNYLQTRWHIDDLTYGLFGSIMALGGMLLHLFLGNFPPRRMVSGLLIMAAVYCILLLWSGNPYSLAIAYFFRSGYIIIRDYLDALTSRIAPTHQIGSAFATGLIAYLVAMMLANALAGRLYAYNINLPFWVSLVGLPMVAILTWQYLPRTKD
ncbi:MAG TPA: MFS transporter [Anaerolineales bacterium]|nr:MFS transporter [Anaerolineales bacterium]